MKADRPRHHHRRLAGWAAALLLCAAALPTSVSSAAAAEQDPDFEVLVFSKTAGFRHDSIEPGVAALTQLGEENGFEVTATERSSAFTRNNLARYEAVVFLSTTGNILNPGQQRAFEDYIADGGGYAGIHAASDTEYEWPWYGGLVGAYFDSHPQIQPARILVEDHDHPAMAHFDDDGWELTDEWYNFGSNPRENVDVLGSLDETSYEGGTMGGDHPIVWCHEYDGGRAFYTGVGHRAELYSDEAFLQHLSGGIRYAAGVVDADCQP